MSDIPIIKIPKMRSTGDEWCKHYAGFYKPGIGKGEVTHCDAGVEYASVQTKVEFGTIRHGEKTPFFQKVAHPCFKHQFALTGGCAKCEFPTDADLAKIHAERDVMFNSIGVAREAILQELRRRWKEGPIPEHGITAPADISRFHKPQTNYFCGAGIMACPICKTGKLKYSRSTYNGHVHAKCSTEKCVAWME